MKNDLDSRLKQVKDKIKVLEAEKEELKRMINPLGRLNAGEGDSERISQTIKKALKIEEEKGHTLRFGMITSKNEISITIYIIKNEPPPPKSPEPRFIKEADLGPKKER